MSQGETFSKFEAALSEHTPKSVIRAWLCGETVLAPELLAELHQALAYFGDSLQAENERLAARLTRTVEEGKALFEAVDDFMDEHFPSALSNANDYWKGRKRVFDALSAWTQHIESGES